MAIPLRYNIRNVMQRPVSTLTTMAGIGLTVTILIAALSLAAGFQASLRETGSLDNALLLRSGADSEISSGISRQAVDIVRSSPAVAIGPDGRPMVSAEVVVLTNKPRLGQPGSSNLTVRGVDPAALNVRHAVKIVAGRAFTPGTDEVIVGRRIAPRFEDTKIGDRIQFQKRTFTVVGHFSADGSSFESEIWGDVAVMAPAFGREDAYQSVTFRMRDPSRFKQIETEMKRDPRLQVQVRRERDFYAEQSQLLSTLIRVLGVFITVIMALGAMFGAMNTMYAAVGSRTREIATLLVLGFTPLAIMTSFLFESVFLALLGGLLGCLLALPINGITTSTTNFQSFSEVAFAFRVTPVAMAIGLVFALMMGVGGGLLPAIRAGRQPLAAALRQM